MEISGNSFAYFQGEIFRGQLHKFSQIYRLICLLEKSLQLVIPGLLFDKNCHQKGPGVRVPATEYSARKFVALEFLALFGYTKQLRDSLGSHFVRGLSKPAAAKAVAKF